MLRIGLTGGIGSGKTAVAEEFSKYGTPVIDADRIAHELVMPDMPALKTIIKIFGDELLDDNGYLKRDQLRKLVFADKEKRKKLESILHPLILKKMESIIANLQSQYCILVIPLLLETDLTKWVDKILVIDASNETQIKRIKKRDHLSQEEIQSILDVQCSREQRLQAANEVITNEGSFEDLSLQVRELHEKFQKLSNTTP